MTIKTFQDGGKIPAEVVTLCAKLGLDESIVSVLQGKDHRVIVTELRIVSVSSRGDKKWEHGFHKDVIRTATLRGNTIEVTEFDGGSYSIDAATGE